MTPFISLEMVNPHPSPETASGCSSFYKADGNLAAWPERADYTTLTSCLNRGPRVT